MNEKIRKELEMQIRVALEKFVNERGKNPVISSEKTRARVASLIERIAVEFTNSGPFVVEFIIDSGPAGIVSAGNPVVPLE